MQDTIVIKANSQRVINVPGTVVVCISATARFQLETGRNGKRDMVPGNRFKGEPFTRLTFTNPSPSENVITYEAGGDELVVDFPPQDGATVLAKNAETVLLCYSGAMASSGSADFEGVLPLGNRFRKSIAVSNLTVPTGVLADDYAAVLHLGDGSDDGLPIYPGESKILEVGGFVQISNHSDSEIPYSVAEVFYT